MEMFQQLVIVAVILAVLCGGLWVLKRKGWAQTTMRRSRADGQPRLEVIDRLTLTPHHSLHLIRLADRTLLVGISPNGCNLLECPPSAAIPSLGPDR
ncbi:MAG: flagellar biosynthetic protein FliO [Bryobacteraceae bacterium]|jgi:flagellar biosynthetic protein FliO